MRRRVSAAAFVGCACVGLTLGFGCEPSAPLRQLDDEAPNSGGAVPSQPTTNRLPSSFSPALGDVERPLLAPCFDCPPREVATEPAVSPSAGTAPASVVAEPESSDVAGAVEVAAVQVPEGLQTVILISVDGLASRFLEDLLRLGRLPAFARLEAEGSFTHNARTEARISVTIPNHVSMVTGRPAVAAPELPSDAHHGVEYNYDPGGEVTIHDSNPNLGYAASVFDEVHDRGGYTALYAGKSKFDLLRRSYSAPYSRPDVIGEDDGPDKVDDFGVAYDVEELVPAFLEAVAEGVLSRPGGKNFAMLHYANTDVAGHSLGWGSPEYLEAVLLADEVIGQVLSFITSTPQLKNTAVIVTADHGGIDFGHYDATDTNINRIPFILWGLGVPAGANLYALCGSNRRDPGDTAPLELPPPGPVRNGDAANLALALLGIEQIEGAMHRDMFQSVRAIVCPPHDAGVVNIGEPADASVSDAPTQVVEASPAASADGAADAPMPSGGDVGSVPPVDASVLP